MIFCLLGEKVTSQIALYSGTIYLQKNGAIIAETLNIASIDGMMELSVPFLPLAEYNQFHLL